MDPIQANGIAIRYLDGKPSLAIFTNDGSVVYELRPVQVLQLATEAAQVAWSNFDIKERN